MADSRFDPNIYLVIPDTRGVFHLNAIHIPRRLKQQLRQDRYEITVNEAFPTVIEQCASVTKSRPETWINSTIINLYCNLHRDGFAHSLEVWDGNELVGGIYGVAIGSVFFGESMFSSVPNTSKIAFMHLAARLIRSGFLILDAQLASPHLEQFGVAQVSNESFCKIMAETAKHETSFDDKTAMAGAEVVRIIESANY